MPQLAKAVKTISVFDNFLASGPQQTPDPLKSLPLTDTLDRPFEDKTCPGAVDNLVPRGEKGVKKAGLPVAFLGKKT